MNFGGGGAGDSVNQALSKLIYLILVILLVYIVIQVIVILSLVILALACNFITATCLVTLAFRQGVGRSVLPNLLFLVIPAAWLLADIALNGGGSLLKDHHFYEVPNGQRVIYWLYLPTLALAIYAKIKAPIIGGTLPGPQIGWSRLTRLFPGQQRYIGVVEVSICFVAGAGLWPLDGSGAVFIWGGGAGLGWLHLMRAFRQRQHRQELWEAEATAAYYQRQNRQAGRGAPAPGTDEVFEVRDFEEEEAHRNG